MVSIVSRCGARTIASGENAIGRVSGEYGLGSVSTGLLGERRRGRNAAVKSACVKNHPGISRQIDVG